MKKLAQAAIIIASAAVILVFLLAPRFYHTENLCFQNADVMELNEGWNYENADGDLRPVLLPATIKDAPADALTVTRVLPAAFSHDTALCLRTSQQSLRAYLGDTLIYERGSSESQYFGDCIGSSWNIISLPESAAGQTLTLVLSSPYTRTSNHVNEVLYGTQTALLYRIAQTYAPALIAAVLFFLVGIILLASHFVLHEIRFQNPILLYLGEFIILISLWFLGESKMLQFFCSDSIFITTLPFFALLLLPMPSALYMRAIHSKRWQKGFSFFFLIYCVNFLVFFTLVLLGKIGIYQTVFCTDILLGAGLVYCLFATVSDAFRHSDTCSWLNVVSAGILIVSGGAELLHFIQGNLLEVSDFLRLGILLMVAVNGLYYLHRIVRATEDEREKSYYEKIAYTDLLTGGLNRSAFYRDVDALVSQYDQITVIQFDLNRLKYINDNFGHAVGDEALSNAYRCIKAAFGSFGSCYRTGGDEFICLLHQISAEELKARVATFEQLVAQAGSGKAYPFGVALGTALYEKGKGSFKQFMIRADQQMYKDKKQKEASLATSQDAE